jgi:hypothetical protein
MNIGGFLKPPVFFFLLSLLFPAPQIEMLPPLHFPRATTLHCLKPPLPSHCHPPLPEPSPLLRTKDEDCRHRRPLHRVTALHCLSVGGPPPPPSIALLGLHCHRMGATHHYPERLPASTATSEGHPPLPWAGVVIAGPSPQPFSSRRRRAPLIEPSPAPSPLMSVPSPSTSDAGLHRPRCREPRWLARPRPGLEATAASPHCPGGPPLHPEATTVCWPRRRRELHWGLNPLKFCILNKKFEC